MLVISQPTFFPWIGYFDLIDQADTFVILDDVKFAKQSWQQRNNFKSDKGLVLFTMPIVSNKNENLINEISIFNPDRIKKKFDSFLRTNYSKAKYFKDYFSIYIKCFNKSVDTGKIGSVNKSIIKVTLDILKIKTKINFSSNIKINKKKSEKIIQICKNLNEKNYLTSVGAEEYLLEDKPLFLQSGINVFLHNYKHPDYNQLYKPFTPYACVLDLLMNEGNNSMKIIRSGRKISKLLF